MKRGNDYENDPTVKVMKSSQLKDGKLQIDNLCILLVHAVWCGHCQHFMPDFHKIANRAKQSNLPIVFAKFESDESSQEAIKRFNEKHPKFSVKGFPTLLIFKHGDCISQYNGSRDPDSLFNFVRSLR